MQRESRKLSALYKNSPADVSPQGDGYPKKIILHEFTFSLPYVTMTGR